MARDDRPKENEEDDDFLLPILNQVLYRIANQAKEINKWSESETIVITGFYIPDETTKPKKWENNSPERN